MFSLNGLPQKSTPSHLAFTRNPIILKADALNDGQQALGYPYTIYLGEKPIYNGRYFYPHFINLSDIVDAFVPKLWEADDIPTEGPLIEIEDLSTIADREIYIDFNGEYDEELGFIALPGGISKQNFRRVNSPSTDIFTKRFCANDTNFFLTTRTADWQLVIKETELYPLYMIIDNHETEIKFVERVTGKEWIVDRITAAIYALDVEYLRKYFYDNEEVLANSFDIYKNGTYACRLIIENAAPAKERYRLKFRNSLGVFEIIELTGEATIAPQWEDSEDSVFKRYDETVADYISERARAEQKQVITVNSGVKRPDEIRFMLDMLASDEVYLLDFIGVPLRVLPSAEEMTYKRRPAAPQSITLTLEIAESESNILQDIVDGSESKRPRVFSDEFSKQFN